MKRKFAELIEGNMVIVWLRPEQYPKGAYKKLHSKNVGPYKILRKTSPNAYVLDLPENMGINKISNIEDHTLYPNPKAATSINGPNGHLLPAPWLKEKIEKLLITKLFQPEEEVIKSILLNGEKCHFEIVCGSQAMNFSSWIVIFMRNFMPLTCQGWVFRRAWGVLECSYFQSH